MLRKTETLGTLECRHSKRRLRIQYIELLRPAALLKNSESHFFEHVDDVVAGNTVGSETNGNAGSPDFIETCDAMAKLRIRFRTVNDRRALCAENVEIGIFEIDSVNQ